MLKGAPWVGSYSVVQWVRGLMGQPLYCSAANAGCGGARLWWWPHPLAWLSSIALLPWLPGFPPQAFPTTISSLTSPRAEPSLRSKQQPSPLDCSTIPKLQLPATAPSSGPASLSRVCVAAAKIAWFSFHLGSHRSALSLPALNVSPLTQTIAMMWGSEPCFSSPPTEGWPSPNDSFSP